MICFNEKKSQPAEDLFRPKLSIDVTSKDILKKAEFIHDNSKEYLLNTIETRNNLEKKGILILSFIFAFISFCIFHTLNLPEKNLHLWTIFFILTIVFYLLIAIPLVFKCVYPKHKAISGNEPRNLLIQKNIEQHYEIMVIAETMTYQERINTNEIANKKTVFWLKLTIRCIFVHMITFVVMMIINYFL